MERVKLAEDYICYMENGDLYLREDFFENEFVRWLRSQEKGDAYLLNFLRLMLLSRENQGVLSYAGKGESLDAEIANVLGEDLCFVKKILSFLKAEGIIKEVSAEKYIIAWNNIATFKPESA